MLYIYQKGEKQRKHQERFYTRMVLLFENAGVYPKWAVISFIVAILISVASLLYAYRTKATLEKLEDINHTEQVTVFKSGKASSINEYKSPK